MFFFRPYRWIQLHSEGAKSVKRNSTSSRFVGEGLKQVGESNWSIVIIPTVDGDGDGEGREGELMNDIKIDRWGFNASRYALETLATCLHNHELEQADSQDEASANSHANLNSKSRPYLNESPAQVHVHLDCYTMGLGGYDSW